MISATILAIFFVPVFFIFVLGAVEKIFSAKSPSKQDPQL
jgi:multidrug efflux pump